MRVLARLKNAYETDGIKEIVRKLIFHSIYRINNKKTAGKVENREFEIGVTNRENSPRIIVSLTSFPRTRLNTIFS